MYRLTVLIAVLSFVAPYTLFDAKDAISSGSTNLRIVSRSKRGDLSQEMPRYYDVELYIEGNPVTMKLTRYYDSLLRYRTEWASYTSRKLSGVFIVRRDNTTDPYIEGFLVYAGTQYLVQPNSVNRSHLLHKIAPAQPDIKIFGPGKESKKGEHQGKARHKRNPTLLKKNLFFMCQMLFDSEALRFAEARLRQVKQEALARVFLEQFAVLAQTYVDESFATLHDVATISFSVTRDFRVMEEPLPEVAELPHARSKNMIKLTTCAKETLDAVARANKNWQEHEHLIVFTGMGVRMDGSMERTYPTRRCAGKAFIMNPRPVTEYGGETPSVYSDCSKGLLSRFLRNFPTDKSSSCFQAKPSISRKPKDMGVVFSRYDQCWLAVNGRPLPEQDERNICYFGLQCQIWNNVVRIPPLPGTFCKGPDAGKEYVIG